MRLADLPRSRSRRQERREKEAEEMRHAPLERAPAPEESAKPAKLKPGEWRPPRLLSSSSPVNDRKIDWLPDQEVLIRTSIRPQQQVEVIASAEKSLDGVDARHSIIHVIDDKKGLIYLAQTTPPFMKSFVGQDLDLSFLGRYFDVPGGRWLRVGYQAKMLGLIRDFPVRQGWSEDVIVVPKPKKLKPSSLRLAYRVVPPNDLDLRLAIWPDGTSLGIMDLSAGGAQFYHESRYFWPKGRQLGLILVSGEFKVILEARVVRTSKVRDITGRLVGVTSVTYTELEPSVRHKYMNFLVEVYRHALAQRSGVE